MSGLLSIIISVILAILSALGLTGLSDKVEGLWNRVQQAPGICSSLEESMQGLGDGLEESMQELGEELEKGLEGALEDVAPVIEGLFLDADVLTEEEELPEATVINGINAMDMINAITAEEDASGNDTIIVEEALPEMNAIMPDEPAEMDDILLGTQASLATAIAAKDTSSGIDVINVEEAFPGIDAITMEEDSSGIDTLIVEEAFPGIDAIMAEEDAGDSSGIDTMIPEDQSTDRTVPTITVQPTQKLDVVSFGNGYSISVPYGYQYSYSDEGENDYIEGINAETGAEFGLYSMDLSRESDIDLLYALYQPIYEDAELLETNGIPYIQFYIPETDVDICLFLADNQITSYVIAFNRTEGTAPAADYFATLNQK